MDYYTWKMRRNYPTARKRRKANKEFHIRGELKIKGKKDDMRECKVCRKILPLIAFTTYGSDRGVYDLRKYCRECHSKQRAEVEIARKTAPPKPDRCARCHKKEEKLQLDHIHGSTTFRGWLCGTCNTGMGKLGDNLEGVLQGAIYLENDENKIIETLHKVFNEMFARTR